MAVVEQVDSLRSTCSLTEVILTGKDIELLLLKQEVQEKLDSLSTINIKNLPQTTSKRVEFIAGEVDLGYIHDYDRPLLSKLRPRRATAPDVSSGSTNTPSESVNIETQTDSKLTSAKHKHASSSSSSSSSDSDSSDSSDSESDVASTKNKKASDKVELKSKVELVDVQVQTESQSRRRSASASSSSSSSSDDESSKVEQGTMTDQVSDE